MSFISNNVLLFTFVTSKKINVIYDTVHRGYLKGKKALQIDLIKVFLWFNSHYFFF